MKKNNFKTYYTAGGILGLILILHFFGLLKPIEKSAAKLLNPVLSGFYSLSSKMRVAFDEQTGKIDWIEKTRELSEEVIRLTEENANWQMLEEENSLLREHLDFLSKHDFHYVMANVISRGDISDIYGRTETIVIDKGKSDGIYPGLVVAGSQGTIIGKVEAVEDAIAKVQLVNNPNCKIAASVLNDGMTSGVTEGELGLTVKMNFIPQGKALNVGDIIVSSGLEQAVPRGLLIGKISQVQSEQNELWQTAVIEPLESPDQEIIVSVVMP